MSFAHFLGACTKTKPHTSLEFLAGAFLVTYVASMQFLGACTKTKPYMLVLEYLPGGSLADLLRTPEFHPSLRRAIVMALDCAKAMTYLHAHMCAPVPTVISALGLT